MSETFLLSFDGKNICHFETLFIFLKPFPILLLSIAQQNVCVVSIELQADCSGSEAPWELIEVFLRGKLEWDELAFIWALHSFCRLFLQLRCYEHGV